MINYRKTEKIVKGYANHRRIQILELLENKPELSDFDISEKLKVDFKTISAHVSKLANAGLVLKRNEGNFIRHKVSKKGLSILKFLRILE